MDNNPITPSSLATPTQPVPMQASASTAQSTLTTPTPTATVQSPTTTQPTTQFNEVAPTPTQPAPTYDWNRYDVPKTAANRFVDSGEMLDGMSAFKTETPTNPPEPPQKARAVLDMPSHKRHLKQLVVAVIAVALFALGASLAGLKNNSATNKSSLSLANQSSATDTIQQPGLGQALVKINRDTVIGKGNSFTANGPVIIQDENNSSSAFKIQNATGTNLFIADTINNRVGIGTVPTTNGAALQVGGDISTNGKLVAGGGVTIGADGLRFGSTLVCSANGCISSSSPAPTPTNPTIDVANVAFLNKNQTLSGNNTFSSTNNNFTGNGAGLSSLNATNLSLGTVNDARLSANIAKLSSNQIFTGSNLIKGDNSSLFQIQNSAATSNLLVADTINTRIGIGATPANGLLTVGTNTNAPSGGIYFGTDTTLYRLAPSTLRTGGNFESRGYLQLGIDDNVNSGLYFGSVADISLKRAAVSSLVLQGTSNSTKTFQIQDAAGTSNLFVADTTNNRIGVGILPGYTLDINGDINTAGSYRINGTQISSAALSNDANLTKNSANNSFTGTNSFVPTTDIVGATVKQTTAASPASDVFDVTNSSGATKYLAVTTAGTITTSGILNATTLQQGGTAVLLQNASFGGDVSGTYNAIAIGTGKVTSTHILDGTIVDADINAAAAIADTKLNTIATAGKVSDTALSANIARLGSNNTFAGTVAVSNTSTTAFQVQKASGGLAVLVGDTTNMRVAVNQASATYTLDVAGDINTSSAYRVAGTAGSSVSCTSGNVIQNPVVAGGIITGGTCVANGGGTSPTFAQIYASGANNTDETATLTTARGGLVIQDAATPIAADLFTVQNNGGGTKYLNITSAGAAVAGNISATGTGYIGTSSSNIQFNYGSQSALASGLTIGYNQTYNGTALTNAGYLQAETQGTGYRNLLLNPLGGNVGIGITSAPGQKLEVGGSIRLGAGSLIGFGATESIKFQDGGSNILNMYTNGILQLSLDASGNLSLGGNGLLVMGTKALDPTCTTGATYYNSATNSFRGCQGPSGATAWMDLISPPGSIIQYAGASAPAGYFIADGSAVSRTTYSRLFAAIGTAYGAGDGSTTFNLPDFRGRSAVGLNTSETTRTDVTALGNNEGAVLGSRTPYHKSTKNGAASMTGANSTIALTGANSTIGLTGSNSTISLGGSNSSISWSGGNSTLSFNMNPDVFNHNPSTGSTGTGSGDRNLLNLGLSGSNSTWSFSGSNSSLFLSGSNSTLAISGSNSTLSQTGSNSTIGVSDTITVGPQANTPTDTGAYLTINYIIKF